MIRVGLIGLDTSHVPAYTKHLNDAKDPEYVPGAKVVVGCPAPTPGVELSTSRVQLFTAQLRDKFGVKIVDTPQDVAQNCDLVMITSVDGRRHLELFKQIAEFKRPTYIDKPMTASTADAKEIFRIADELKFPVMSCSSLRYSDALVDALHADKSPILGCDVFGPMPEEPFLPGLFWYGIHCVEVMNTIMGNGCRQVRTVHNPDFDFVTAVFGDGRVATIRGSHKGYIKFGATIHRQNHSQFVDLQNVKKSWLCRLLEVMLANLPQGKSPIDEKSTLEIIRFIEAANESRASGNPVNL